MIVTEAFDEVRRPPYIRRSLFHNKDPRPRPKTSGERSASIAMHAIQELLEGNRNVIQPLSWFNVKSRLVGCREI